MITDKNQWINLEILLDADGESHFHQELELLFVLEGEINVKLEQEVNKMAPGDVLLINSMKQHSIHRVLNVEKKSLVCCIHISYRMLCEYTGNRKMLYWCNSMRDSDNATYNELRNIFNNLLLDFTNGDSGQYFYRYSLYYQLLHYLVNYFVAAEDHLIAGDRKMQEEARLAEIIQYVEMNYDRDLNLQELSEQLHLSPSYLSKYLKKKMGTNFVKYLYSVRMHHALEELLYTEKQVTHVAMDNGFPSVAMFNKQFKEQHDCTPSVYRQKMKVPISQQETALEKKKKLIDRRLKQHFGLQLYQEDIQKVGETGQITVDIQVYQPYHPIWNQTMNAGDAEYLLSSSVQVSVSLAIRRLRLKRIRFWNIFSKEMHVVGKEQWNFRSLRRILDFLLENHVQPVIELGEKPRRILKTVKEHLKESENVSQFKNYQQFLDCLDAMMQYLVSCYGQTEVEQWGFELWDDRRIEVYADKQPYMQVFKDCCDIIRKHAPKGQIGGAGNHLGWYKEHTSEAIRRWIDHGIYPDYLTFIYYPYAGGEIQNEIYSRRKSDEEDFVHVISELKQLLTQYGFPNKKLYISEWNMTVSSRNYFNDSLWKGCYMIKTCIDLLGKVDGLTYVQLLDETTEYYDSQKILNGSAGLLTIDQIEKPAFLAMRMLAHLRKYLIAKGENYIITRDDEGNITIVMHNFIRRNYLYYVKPENETTVEDHYSYFEHQNKKQIRLMLTGLFEDRKYLIRQQIINRENGSIMDEWKQFSFIEALNSEDVDYLKRSCSPKMLMNYVTATAGQISLPITMQPLELRQITLYPFK